MGKRVKAWSLHHKKPFPDEMKFIVQPFDLLSTDVSELSRAVIFSGGAGGLIIIDTLNRATPGADENSSVDMGRIISAATHLHNLTGGLVLLVHHVGKDASKELRGHTSLLAALDGAIKVLKSNGHLEWVVAKSKDDVSGSAYPFKLEIVPVGLEDDVQTITSCVVVPGGVADKTPQHKPPTPRGRNQKIIWDALTKCDLLLHSKDYAKGGAPSGKACIRVEAAIEQVKGRLLCEQRRQFERAQAAISGLVLCGLLGHQDGWLWVV